MAHPALTVLVGLVAGVLSGAFGIGGGLVTTPAIRMLLGYPALIAVGTPLPVIIPTALAGALAHRRTGAVDARAACIMAAFGAGSAVLGAWLARLAGGELLMLATAALIAWVAAGFIRAGRMDRAGRGASPLPEQGVEDEPLDADEVAHSPWQRLALVGVVTGLYSGLLGLGGGFVIVPALVRWLGWPIRRAIGTSLAAVALLAVPGTVTHYSLGHVDPLLAMLLAFGAVPGAYAGAKLVAAASERHVSAAFGILLVVTACALAYAELAALTP